MQRHVNWEGGCLSYELTMKKVKNINLRVREGRIVVSAPLRTAPPQVDRIVLSRAAWLAAALEKQAARPCSVFEPGGQVYLQGRALPLIYVSGSPQVTAAGGELLVSAPSPAEIRTLLRRFMEKEAAPLFSQRLKALYPIAAAAGVAYPRLRLRWMTGRWGSCACTGGSITLNKALLAASPVCLDYVILHELCHFLHPNHSSAFYRTLADWMPEYRAAQDRLKGISPVDWTP